jgi:hypothetical protein
MTDDAGRAIEGYAQQLERQACEIRLRAERKAGQLLAQMDKLKGRPEKASSTVTLSDVGVSRNQSSQWQRLAQISAAQTAI